MAKDPQKIDVTLEDQENINKFSKLNTKLHELKALIGAKKKVLEDLEDAGNELMLSDEENIRYVIGECFVHLEKEAAEERLQSMSDTVGEEVKGLESEVEDVEDSMKKLKALLYTKFGSSINLEE